MKFQRTSSHPHAIVLEQYPSDIHTSRLNTLWRRIKTWVSPDAIWSTIAKRAAGSSDPIIEQRRDRQGYAYYIVYDPTTQERSICSSETEVRAWLERRYYQ